VDLPIYGIKCSVCDWKGEVWCKFEELDKQVCQGCGSQASKEITSCSFNVRGYSSKNNYERTLGDTGMIKDDAD
jgi:predicted nucleic acid-binding Zn ribbon protein